MPTLDGATVVITGANGGIGRELVSQALERGARKVYATARVPQAWSDARIVPLALDVTDPVSVAAAADAASDATVLINNAGANPPTASLIDIDDAALDATFAVNFFGPVRVARAFAPVLTGRAGAAIVDIHSIGSWYAYGGAYSAAKAALWSATNSLRLELAPRGVHVLGVHMSYVDTPMAAHAGGDKLTPADLVGQVLDGLEADRFEVLADEATRRVRAGLAAPVEELYPELSGGRS
ncbi:SDR family oxidoreductase [Microbacterium sp. VKM Ac-2923]|uniref:SDR family oxidoreductase n=1 Tax=Microbacterium sp. VKM Ac-2923 TaxID=2929476 RepID=UPI001FB54ABE|nr:SDR family oxidoreductase [Microbacterium sp. VKM Ac-2923]MCJ1708850.1 SDR family oxidoreductase [Microbacterium sp. VKM Ac-2923]